jgi:hypothetical protein
VSPATKKQQNNPQPTDSQMQAAFLGASQHGRISDDDVLAAITLAAHDART